VATRLGKVVWWGRIVLVVVPRSRKSKVQESYPVQMR
jgi:hypothetical protein